MGNILNDIVDDINIKPNKTKLILKWVFSISGSLIVLAFAFGQFKSSFFNRMDKFEDTLKENNQKLDNVEDRFDELDKVIQNIYIDGFELFNDFQEFNKKQLILVIDYGQSNKELLKQMIELNIDEKTKKVENEIIKNEKSDTPQPSIKAKPIQ